MKLHQAHPFKLAQLAGLDMVQHTIAVANFIPTMELMTWLV
jgi:hypothetical protein